LSSVAARIIGYGNLADREVATATESLAAAVARAG
jgi:hypothetical protein